MAKTEHESACQQIRLMAFELMQAALDRNWNKSLRILEDLIILVRHVKKIEER